MYRVIITLMITTTFMMCSCNHNKKPKVIVYQIHYLESKYWTNITSKLYIDTLIKYPNEDIDVYIDKKLTYKIRE